MNSALLKSAELWVNFIPGFIFLKYAMYYAICYAINIFVSYFTSNLEYLDEIFKNKIFIFDKK